MAKSLDIPVALLALVASAGVFVTAYAKVISLEVAPSSLLGTARQGVTSYRVMSGGKCVGDFKVTARDRELTEILVIGKIRVAEALSSVVPDPTAADNPPEEASVISVRLSSFFNPLGQLFRATAMLEFQGLSGSIALANTHPIEATVSVKSTAANYNQTFSIPGPILVEKRPMQNQPTADAAPSVPAVEEIEPLNEYRVQYYALESLLPAIPRDLTQSLSGQSLVVEPVPYPPACAGVPTGAIALTSFTQPGALQSLSRLLQMRLGKTLNDDLPTSPLLEHQEHTPQ